MNHPTASQKVVLHLLKLGFEDEQKCEKMDSSPNPIFLLTEMENINWFPLTAPLGGIQ